MFADFCSVAQMARLYLFLAEHAKFTTVLETFKAHPSIFLPSSSINAREDVLQGSLVALGNVFWDDSTGALAMLRTLDPSSRKKRCSASEVHSSMKAISGYYPELRTFFVGQCSVRENPDFYGYISILKEIAAITSPSSVLNQVDYHL